MALLQLLEKTHPDLKCCGNVYGENRFIGMMADSTRAAQEQHGSGHPASDNHGIVTCTARHAMKGTAA
jgi:hypothetical protein